MSKISNFKIKMTPPLRLLSPCLSPAIAHCPRARGFVLKCAHHGYDRAFMGKRLLNPQDKGRAPHQPWCPRHPAESVARVKGYLVIQEWTSEAENRLLFVTTACEWFPT